MIWYSRCYVLIYMIFTCFFMYGRTTPCPGEFGVSAEWLYGLPAIEDPEFALVVPVVAGGDTNFFPTNQNWHSGYRIDLVYNFCYCPIDIRFRWTHFPSFSDSKTVSGPADTVLNLLIPFDDGSEASVKDTFNFYYADLLLGWEAIDCCPFLLSFQGGIQYARLRFTEDSSILGDQGSITGRTKSRLLWGVGPEIGADFNFSFWKCFGLAARSYASLLISKQITRQDIQASQGSPAFDHVTSNKNYIYLRPFLNTRAGFTYSRSCDLNCGSCFGPFNLDIEVGYEASWLFNSVGRASFSEGAVNVKWMTFSIHGPYVHVGIAF